VIRLLIEVLVFRRCKECGHANFVHKSMSLEDRKVIGCRVQECECYKEEKTPDFLLDCYGYEEHEHESIGGTPSGN
jgi:hypothetical protein